MLFNIFGQYVFGDLEVPGLSAQLAELLLPNTKSKTWSDFIITAGEQHEDFGKGRADSDMDLDALVSGLRSHSPDILLTSPRGSPWAGFLSYSPWSSPTKSAIGGHA